MILDQWSALNLVPNLKTKCNFSEMDVNQKHDEGTCGSDADDDFNTDTWDDEWDNEAQASLDAANRSSDFLFETGGHAAGNEAAEVGESVVEASKVCHSFEHPSDNGQTSSERLLPSQRESAVSVRMAIGSKAGMDGVDKQHVNAVIQSMSEGSRFYENEKRKSKMTEDRIQKMLSKRDQLKRRGVLDSIITQRRVDALVESLEQSRNLSRCIVHVDMDMFYAAVEMRDDPSLREKPMAVGGIGMLSTSNYAARKFGVRAAMPGYIALKLCPDLVIVPSRFDAYRIASDQVGQSLDAVDAPFVRLVAVRAGGVAQLAAVLYMVSVVVLEWALRERTCLHRVGTITGAC
eukprot:m.1533101 g.1533101  ORF g.1533101 m.1533101 type:complete len:348 (+) comp25243_c0_seq3:2682-3725(+)